MELEPEYVPTLKKAYLRSECFPRLAGALGSQVPTVPAGRVVVGHLRRRGARDRWRAGASVGVGRAPRLAREPVRRRVGGGTARGPAGLSVPVAALLAYSTSAEVVGRPFVVSPVRRGGCADLRGIERWAFGRIRLPPGACRGDHVRAGGSPGVRPLRRGASIALVLTGSPAECRCRTSSMRHSSAAAQGEWHVQSSAGAPDTYLWLSERARPCSVTSSSSSTAITGSGT